MVCQGVSSALRKADLGMFWEDAGVSHSALLLQTPSPGPGCHPLSLSLGFLLLVGCAVIPKRKSALSLISTAKRTGGRRRDQQLAGPHSCPGRTGEAGLADTNCLVWDLHWDWLSDSSSNQNPVPSASKARVSEEHKLSKYLS